MDVEECMETKISEIADGIYRLSTYVPDIAPPAGFTYNQFLVLGDEPLMFHTGLRKMFPVNRDALSRIMPADRLDRVRAFRGRRVRRDRGGQQLAYVYFENEPGRRSAAKLLTKDEAR